MRALTGIREKAQQMGACPDSPTKPYVTVLCTREYTITPAHLNEVFVEVVIDPSKQYCKVTTAMVDGSPGPNRCWEVIQDETQIIMAVLRGPRQLHVMTHYRFGPHSHPPRLSILWT